MPTTTFTNAYFLQSIGWGIANSLWQAAILWLIFRIFIFTDKKLTASIKYHFSFTLLVLSFAWFIVTVTDNYSLLLNTAESTTRAGYYQFKQLNKILPFLGIIYFSLLIVCIIRFIRHYLKIRFVRTNGLSKPSLDIRLFTLNTAVHLGIKKKITVWLSEYIEVPSVTGFIKPVILLPLCVMNNLSTEQVNAILVHELAHIKRNDYLMNFIQSIIALLLFFNPFIVLLGKAAKKERENCCDDSVLNYQFNGLEYARALLLLEEQRKQHLSLILSATNNKKILLQRIKRIVTASTSRPDISFSKKIKLAFTGFIFLAAMCLIAPSATKNSNDQKKQADNVAEITTISSEGFPQQLSSENEILPVIIPQKGLTRLNTEKPKVSTRYNSGKAKPVNQEKQDYLLALVNEDQLLNTSMENDEAAPKAILNKAVDSVASLIIKVEEQQSGKQEVNTYYFNIKDYYGNTEITPLLLMKKYKATIDKYKGLKSKNLKLLSYKKRISI
jgi:beta-lactamase regulating signal transducer with metallopeptidase domain